MAEENNVAAANAPSAEQKVEDVKGKGKAPATENPAPVVDDDEDDEDEEEDEHEGAHGQSMSTRLTILQTLTQFADEEEADEDNMEEIEEENIIADGRRTRGKNIDFAKAAEGLDDEDLEDDEEDDGDFEDPDAMED